VTQQTKQNAVKNYTGIGFQLVAFVLILVYGGNWADHYFSTYPIFLLSGVFLAVFGVIYTLISKFK
jgi:VIT1/CCC1 family predicted Fe2+/Mn2+ transporter